MQSVISAVQAHWPCQCWHKILISNYARETCLIFLSLNRAPASSIFVFRKQGGDSHILGSHRGDLCLERVSACNMGSNSRVLQVSRKSAGEISPIWCSKPGFKQNGTAETPPKMGKIHGISWKTPNIRQQRTVIPERKEKNQVISVVLWGSALGEGPGPAWQVACV